MHRNFHHQQYRNKNQLYNLKTLAFSPTWSTKSYVHGISDSHKVGIFGFIFCSNAILRYLGHIPDNNICVFNFLLFHMKSKLHISQCWYSSWRAKIQQSLCSITQHHKWKDIHLDLVLAFLSYPDNCITLGLSNNHHHHANYEVG